MGLFIKNSSHKFIFPSPLLCKLPQAVILCPTSLSQWQWLIESRKLHYLLMLHANHGSFIAYGLVSQCLYLFIYFFWKFKSTKKPLCEKLLGLWQRKKRVARFAGTIKTSLQKWHILLGFIFYSPSNSHDQAWHQQGREVQFFLRDSIRVFSNKLTLDIRWLKYLRFSCNISPSMNIQG